MTAEAEKRSRMPASEPCKVCGRKFSRNDSLTRHMKVHGSHIERGPVHRIINEKFRACANCRKAKVRCPGSTAGGPCARCSQNQQQCTYDKAKTAESPPKTASSPGSISADLKQSSRHSLLSPHTTSSDEPASQSPKPGKPTQRDVEMSEEASHILTDHVPSPPGSPTPPVQQGSSTEEDIRPSFLRAMMDLPPSAAPSTYVSPTLHILDPYSYKLPSIADSHDSPSRNATALTHCRYPVLQYLVPFLDLEFSSILACDLLDTYFSSAFSSRLHPTCHHIHNFILRRCDVLDPIKPRRMHPALLASMLFVAALSDKALSLFSGPEEKDRICKYLSLLTYRLLNPSRHEPLLSHQDLGLPPLCDATPGWTNQDLQQALHPQQQPDSLPITWGTDYIITFIHVSSVISGSEKKAASIRWWSAAFSLARDLKLNQEVELYVPHDDSGILQPNSNCGCSMSQEETTQDFMTEVHREERRRTWWLLFLMDRHLALCYNRPLATLEAECKELLLPLDDITWQSGSQPHSHGTRAEGPRCIVQPAGTGRLSGPPNQCVGAGLFEFFLPLMTITGHLLDFNRAKNHPVLVSAGCSSMWSSQERQILRELDGYQASLDSLVPIPSLHTATTDTPTLTVDPTSPWSTVNITSPPSPSTDSEPTHILKTSSAYAQHIISVLRILVGSKWDPVCLFEDADFWTSSPSFKDSMSHTIAASEHVSRILDLDPDICFMPYFFGIQLLHGSLLLLLVAYRLQADSGNVILAACESVVRATEACFVTLPTDYQRQFRNVMRSAIALAKGRGRDQQETEKQLASVLARYRWSRNGGGLAR